MSTFTGIRSFVVPIMAIAMTAASLVPAPALAQSGTFEMVANYTGIGYLAATAVGPGPTPGSQRFYVSVLYGGGTLDLLSIDPDTGNTQVFHSPLSNEWGAWGMTVAPDGNVYLGTCPNAHFFKLDSKQGTFVDLGRPSSTEEWIWDVAFGSDGRLYGVTYPNAKLVRYDPATGQLADLGRLDPIQQTAHYVAGSKDGFLYVGIGNAKAGIVAYQIGTGQQQEILPPDAQVVTTAYVYLGTDGNIYGSVLDGTSVFRLSQWTAAKLKSGTAVPHAPGNTLSDGRTLSLSDNQGTLLLAVTDPTSDATVTHEIAYSGGPSSLSRVGLGPDGVLYGSTALPMNLIRVDIDQLQTDYLGNLGNGEVYSFLSYGNRLLIGAYAGPSSFMSYQPGIPFSTSAQAENPYLVPRQDGDLSWRSEAMIEGTDGNIYVGPVAATGILESPLVQWNTETNLLQLYDVVPDQSIVSLCNWNNLIIGGSSISGGVGSLPTQTDAMLFVWNPSTQEVEFQIAPVAGAASITDLIAAPNGLVYGIAGKTLFEFNPQTRQITNSQTLPFSGIIYNSVSADDAGRIWGLAESGIFVIDTSKFNTTMIASSPLQITGGFAMGNGNIYFISGPSVYSYTIPLAAAAVAVSPAQTTPSLNTALNVTATVTGTGVAPTGTVTLSGGGYTSPGGTLSGGSYTFTIPANSLNAGADTLTVSYSGDTNYASNTGSTTVTVTVPTFTLAATTANAIAPGSPATSTVTVTGISGYAGTVMLTCSLTSAPSGATDMPTCSGDSSTVTLSSGTTTGTIIFTVSTSAATTARVRPGFGRSSGWCGADGGAVLAVLMCLGIPTRRRSWRSMLGILVVMVALGSLTGCDSMVVRGSSSTGTGNPGTIAGSYTFTVTGTSTPLVSPMPTTAFILTVK